MADRRKVLALSGGVGGARLANGLAAILGAELTVLVNTGDDFSHLGLTICPDLDTVMYTLAGIADPVQGWGRADETWAFMEETERLGGETWFRLGDRDLAVHAERTRRLTAGETLNAVTADLCARFGIASRILPMTDDPVPTLVDTDEGTLAFQDYFVRRRCAPEVAGFRFDGIATAKPNADAMALLDDPALAAIVIGPSNPFVSVAPILALPGLRENLERRRVPLVAVSPVIAGRAVKGPAAKMMAELGITPSAASVAAHYGDLLDGFVVDRADAGLAEQISGVRVLVTDTIMKTQDIQRALASDILAFAAQISR